MVRHRPREIGSRPAYLFSGLIAESKITEFLNILYGSYWTCIGSVDCLRLRTVRGKESIATNKPGLPPGVSPRSYPAG